MTGQESQALVQETPGSLQPSCQPCKMPQAGFTEKGETTCVFSCFCQSYVPGERVLRAASQQVKPQLILMHAVIPPQVQDLAFVFVEFQNFMLCPFLQPVKILLNGSTTLWTEQFTDTFKAVLPFKRQPSSRLAVLTKAWTPSYKLMVLSGNEIQVNSQFSSSQNRPLYQNSLIEPHYITLQQTGFLVN